MSASSNRIIEFVVTGHAPFPIDMLRYDECHPRDESGSHIIARSIEGTGARGQLRVFIQRRGCERWWRPTVARWESFGWKVEAAA